MKRILLIGGTDSSGGAGLTRDVAVAKDFGCQGKPVVTCVTAQTNAAVHLIHEVPGSVIIAQIDAAFADTPPDAIKIGMIGSSLSANAVADMLIHRDIPVVLDPVLRATSGGKLGEDNSLKRLIAMADVITPNLEESARLSNRASAECEDERTLQANVLRGQGARAVLIKGGHSSGEMCCDHLFDEVGHRQYCLPRLKRSKRGTGCSLATALACNMAMGQDVRDACSDAKEYVYTWIAV